MEAPLCECVLHSRWVLIREDERRRQVQNRLYGAVAIGIRRHYAATMCPACECELVLTPTLEDEHRWLQACGALPLCRQVLRAKMLTFLGICLRIFVLVSFHFSLNRLFSFGCPFWM